MKKWKFTNSSGVSRLGAVCVVLCLLLSGCAAGGRTEDAVFGKTDAENDKTNRMEGAGTDSGNKLYLKERQSVRFNEPEPGYQTANWSYDVMDGKIYLFRAEIEDGTGSQRLCVQTFDSKTRAIEQYLLTPEIPGVEEYTFYSAGLTSEGDLSLKLFDLDRDDTSYFLAKVDLQGNVLETADSFPDEAEYPWNMDFSSMKRVFHLADGRTVLSEWNMESFTSRLTWFDGKAGQTFAQIENGDAKAICCDANGILYCLAGDELLRLDLEKDIQDKLFSLNENGMEYRQNAALFPTDEGMLLCQMDKEEIFLFALADQKPVNEEEIRLACLEGTAGIGYIQRKASTFSYDTGSLLINMEAEEDPAQQEDYRKRIQAELAAGKGPDMLLLYKNEADLLAESGYLCDLNDMISDEVKAQMIPSVLELGTVNGELAAITPQVEFNTMITGNQTWEKDRWSISEFKKLVESRDDWEILVTYLNSNLDFYTLYYFMFSCGILNSPLLDLEQGVSHLDSEEFAEILELCKKYSEKKVSLEENEIDALLREGRIAAKRISIYNLSDFSATMSRYAEDCHFVGSPSETGRGSYVDSYSFQYLVVNKNSPHKEEIQKFIAYLLDYDNQFAVDGCSVRMDVIRDSVSSDPYWGYVIRLSDNPGDNKVRGLEDVKPDGTPWLEEFLDFVKESEPAPVLPDEISTIIGNELYSYYEEGRDARKTADNIHNRVQLYLNEKK